MKLQELQQAKKIHGGVASLCVASLGVKLSKVPIPTKRLRRRVFQSMYGDKYASLDESELEKPLDEFRSINELFTRGVRSDLRPLPDESTSLVSPCDSTVQACGQITDDLSVVAKGIPYSVASLIAEDDCSAFSGGDYAVLFLSPADCHRVFAPIDAKLVEIVHVPGWRLLVHPPFQRKEYPVFTLNERVVLQLETRIGRIALVMVAGWGVGNITFPFTQGPNKRSSQISRERFDEPKSFGRGEWLATFELGSTVILLSESSVGRRWMLEPGRSIRYGQAIADLNQTASCRFPSNPTSESHHG